MVVRRTAALLLLAAGGLGCTALPATAAPPDVRSLDGVWRTDGYGEYLRIDGSALSVYQTTSVSCLLGAGGTAASDAGTRRFAIRRDDARTIRLQTASTAIEQVESAASVRLLHRADRLPRRCDASPADGPRAVFDTFWETFAENYPFFALHGVDWSALRGRYRPLVTGRTTPQQLSAIMATMLTPLHDAHVAVLGTDGVLFHRVRPGTRDATPRLDARMTSLLRSVDLPSAGGGPLVEYAQGHIASTVLRGDIGYLRLSGFTGYTRADTETANRAALARTLDEVFAAQRTTPWRGLMIDLRVNGGGSDALALDLAARLTGRAYIAYAKQNRQGAADRVEWSAPQRVSVRPSDRPGFHGPVSVLVSGATESAGETVTQALLARSPEPTLVGENTQGVFSDTLERGLPNGWTVVLPNERYLTGAGRGFDAVGIPPTLRAPLVVHGPHDPLLDAGYRSLGGVPISR